MPPYKKTVQFYRNNTIYVPSENMTALQVAKTQLSSQTLTDGEIAFGRYREQENGDIKTVVAIAHNLSGTSGITFLTSDTIDTSQFVRKPRVLYETDGTTGLLGVNNNALGENWQLENYDFTPYKYLRCYIKIADYKTSSNSLTPAMIIELPLDTASKAKSDNTSINPGQPCDMYIAGGSAVSPSDQNQIFTVLVAVDSTKTKFQVVCENRIYGTAQTNVNNNGRYLYKIEGCYDPLNNAVESGYVETDPVFLASVAHGITSGDVTNWNSKTSNVGTITGITMNNVSKGTSGVVDLGTVITSHQDLSSYADGAEYDSQNKLIYLKHGNTRLSNPIDATAFVKDGMVSTVTVGTGTGANAGVSCLIISFNTDAGKEDIELPISQIFNPNNYYTKTETNNLVKDLDKVPCQQIVPVSSTQTIDPYKMYDLGTVSTALTIVFDTSKEVSGYTKEYMIKFVAASGCDITLPNGTIYANGSTPTYTAGHTYEINIVNGCAVVGEFY